MKKTILLIALISIMTVAMFIPSSAGAAGGKLEIYPTPQVIKYGGSMCTIADKLSVYLGNTLDDVTVDKAFDAVSQLDSLAYVGSEQQKYSLYCGIYGSGDIADTYAKQNGIAASTANLYEKNDAYLLAITRKATVVLGKDTNAAFYGLTTLKAVYAQATDRKIQQLTVEDWSDSVYRGFIEGYYGIPWTTDERAELMRFGGEFKTNIYIYAPKNDPYHSTNWRSLYTDADLQELKEQVKAGEQSKTRFVWAAHPFNHSAILPSTYNNDIAALIAKFEQLYGVGVRQFVVSADDIDGDTVGGPNKWNTALARNVLNDVAKWCKQKGDCYNTIFVPNVYFTESNSDKSEPESKPQNYLSSLVNGLDESVEIMWTGNRVCSSVSNGNFEQFSKWTNRKAFMWLNWPVNDYADGKLIMSKGEVLNYVPTTSEIPFLGIVTNPMQYAEADKLSIFATADYAWNLSGFDVNKSYDDSFKYIESNCPDELREICSHLSNAGLFEGRYFEESKELSEYIDKFLADYDAEADISLSAQDLIDEFNKIASSGKSFLNNASNTKLVSELEPFVNALINKTEACAGYVEVLLNIDRWTPDKIKTTVDKCDSLIKECGKFTTPVLNKISYDRDPMAVDVGINVINGFIKRLDEICSVYVKPILGLPSITYGGFDKIYQGSINNAVDGDESTFVWFGSYPTDKSYVLIGLGEKKTVNSLKIVTGKTDGGDYWNVAVEYSLDGKTFTPIKAVSGAVNTVTLDVPVEAKYIRLRDNSDGSTWVAVREVLVNGEAVMPKD